MEDKEFIEKTYCETLGDLRIEIYDSLYNEIKDIRFKRPIQTINMSNVTSVKLLTMVKLLIKELCHEKGCARIIEEHDQILLGYGDLLLVIDGIKNDNKVDTAIYLCHAKNKLRFFNPKNVFFEATDKELELNESELKAHLDAIPEPIRYR